jgi:hypothetical protein
MTAAGPGNNYQSNMQRKITRTIPITFNGEQIANMKSVTYKQMTEQEINISLAIITIAIVAAAFIAQAIATI